MRVRRTLVALLAAPAVLLAACGGSSSVADPPVSSGPSSAPTTQSPAHESPQHFIRRWADAEKKMENTGRTKAYLAMSSGCAPCQKLANEVRGFYSAGGFVRWRGWQILSIKINSHQGRVTTYEVRNRSFPTRYKEARSGETKHLAGGVTKELIGLLRTEQGWTVTSKAELAS